MMLLSDMFNLCIMEMGHWVTRPTNYEIKLYNFMRLVKSCLFYYNRYCPRMETSRDVSVSDNGYTFPSNTKPLWISDVRIAYASGFSTSSGLEAFGGAFAKLVTPEPQHYYTRSTGILLVDAAGDYDIDCVYAHEITTIKTANGTSVDDPVDAAITDYELVYMDDVIDQVFFRLVKASMLIAIGRSRRAFTHNDLPIASDADTLVSEGQQEREMVEQEIQVNSKTELAMG